MGEKAKETPPPSHFYRQFVFEKDKLNLKMNLF
jgi:signal-transduction protein with cAMP-binding, CBS, and nucleotidyltransferase domain